MNTQVGDVVMSGPAPGKENIMHKGIQVTGSTHTHDELVGEVGGTLVVGNAHTPHYTLDPFENTVRDCEQGRRVAAVFRWHEFVGRKANCPEYRRFQHGVNVSIRTMGELKVPYDKRAIMNHGRNFIRKKLGYLKWLGPIMKHTEYKVFCTESCFIIYDVNGVNLYSLAGNQPLVAPVHTERLYSDRYLMLVKDYGLIELMKKKGVV